MDLLHQENRKNLPTSTSAWTNKTIVSTITWLGYSIKFCFSTKMSTQRLLEKPTWLNCGFSGNKKKTCQH